MIRNVLAEIWLAKPETARRVRQRIGTVLDWAYASGYRESEAPMRAITKGLPKQPKKDGHFATMPYSKVPLFVLRLRERTGPHALLIVTRMGRDARHGWLGGAKRNRAGSRQQRETPLRPQTIFSKPRLTRFSTILSGARCRASVRNAAWGSCRFPQRKISTAA